MASDDCILIWRFEQGRYQGVKVNESIILLLCNTLWVEIQVGLKLSPALRP